MVYYNSAIFKRSRTFSADHVALIQISKQDVKTIQFIRFGHMRAVIMPSMGGYNSYHFHILAEQAHPNNLGTPKDLFLWWNEHLSKDIFSGNCNDFLIYNMGTFKKRYLVAQHSVCTPFSHTTLNCLC